MDINNKEIKVARTISPTDSGFVTADMLYEFLASGGANNIIGGTVNWDVDAININCDGRNVLSASPGSGVTIGASNAPTTVRGDNVRTEAGLLATVKSSGSMNLYAAGQMSLTSQTSLGLYSDLHLKIEGTYIDVYGKASTDIRSGDSPVKLISPKDIIVDAKGEVYLRGHSAISMHSPRINQYPK